MRKGAPVQASLPLNKRAVAAGRTPQRSGVSSSLHGVGPFKVTGIRRSGAEARMIWLEPGSEHRLPYGGMTRIRFKGCFSPRPATALAGSGIARTPSDTPRMLTGPAPRTLAIPSRGQRMAIGRRRGAGHLLRPTRASVTGQLEP